MLTRTPVYHSVLSSISVLPRRATETPSEDAVRHEQTASLRQGLRLVTALSHCMQEPWRGNAQVSRQVYFILFKMPKWLHVVLPSGEPTDHEKKLYIIQFEGWGKCSFLIKLSSVYDWLELLSFYFFLSLFFFSFTEFQVWNADIQDKWIQYYTVTPPCDKAANMRA